MAPQLTSTASAGLPAGLSLPALTPLNVVGLLFLGLFVHLAVKVFRASRSPLYNVPGEPSHNWIVGDFPHMLSEPTGVLQKRYINKHGHTIRTSTGMFTPPGIITSDLTALGYLQRNPDLFIKPPKQSRALRALAGDGVLMAEFHSHRRQRRILNPAFSPAAIRDMTPVFYAKAEELRERIATVIDDDPKHDASPTPPKPEDIVPGSRKLDMGKYLTELAFDVIGMAGFDYDFRCQQTSNPIVSGFRGALSALMRINALAVAQHFWPALEVIPTKRNLEVAASLKRTTDVGRELVAQKRRELLAAEGGIEKSTETGKDLLSLIVKANMAQDLPENQRLSDEEIIYQVSTFLLAGSETTSNGLSWVLWRLAQNPDLQRRLREELSSVGNPEPSLDELNELHLLENVVRETLRIDSPVPETIREATADTMLPLAEPITGVDGTVMTSIPIRKGTFIVEPFLAVHSNTKIWGDDAEVFNPDRFDRPNCPAMKVPGSYGNLLSFNGGARNCIGYRFALLEMKVVLFILLRNFTFDILPSKPEITRKNFIVMLPWVVGEEHVGSQMPLLVGHVRD